MSQVTEQNKWVVYHDEHKEYWDTWHTLRGDSRLKPCQTRCDDPVCEHGCLNKAGVSFRNLIMEGIKILRDQYPEEAEKYKLSVDHFMGHKAKCEIKGVCADPVCTVSGCMKVPAYYHRRLIELAYKQRTFDKLKQR